MTMITQVMGGRLNEVLLLLRVVTLAEAVTRGQKNKQTNKKKQKT